MRSPLITLWRVLQYPISLGVAALVSVIAALLLAGLPLPLMHALVGFLGVFIGSLFFLPCSRWIGAVFLAVIGLGFFYVRFVWFDIGPGSVPDGWLRLAFLALGAFVAVAGHVVWSRITTHDNAA